MEVPRPNPPKRENSPSVVGQVVMAQATSGESSFERLDPVAKSLCIWMANGRTCSAFANKYYLKIVPMVQGDRKRKQRAARNRCRRMVRHDLFRASLYEWGLMQVDLASPQILVGVTKKAIAGRVDAARLLLELTGRHAPNSEVQPAQIQIVMGNVPRPTQISDITIEPDEVVEIDDNAV